MISMTTSNFMQRTRQLRGNALRLVYGCSGSCRRRLCGMKLTSARDRSDSRQVASAVRWARHNLVADRHDADAGEERGSGHDVLLPVKTPRAPAGPCTRIAAGPGRRASLD